MPTSSTSLDVSRFNQSPKVLILHAVVANVVKLHKQMLPFFLVQLLKALLGTVAWSTCFSRRLQLSRFPPIRDSLGPGFFSDVGFPSVWILLSLSASLESGIRR